MVKIEEELISASSEHSYYWAIFHEPHDGPILEDNFDGAVCISFELAKISNRHRLDHLVCMGSHETCFRDIVDFHLHDTSYLLRTAIVEPWLLQDGESRGKYVLRVV